MSGMNQQAAERKLGWRQLLNFDKQLHGKYRVTAALEEIVVDIEVGVVGGRPVADGVAQSVL
jgi:hypothetical protein